MPDGFALLAAAIAAVGVPLVWSGLIALAHRGRPASRKAEIAVLALMLVPVALAILLLMACAWIPAPESATAAPIGWRALRIVPAMAQIEGGTDMLRLAVLAVAIIYLAGLARQAFGLLQEQRRYHRFADNARRHADWPDVYVTDAATTAFADRRGRIVLPAGLLAALPPQQIAMVVAHERAHVAHADPLVYAVLAWIDVVLWFNPFVRRQTRRCRLAAEVACDAAVVAAAPSMRRAYAATIVAALKHTAGDARTCAPAVLSPRNLGDHGMRITEIMIPSPRRGKRLPLVLAALLLVPAGAVQLAYAQAATGATPIMSLPLQGEISAPYGPMKDPFDGSDRFHNGVDIKGKTGAAVTAPAAGSVITVKLGDGANGNVLEIDHGGGLVTRYTHLKSVAVTIGQSVKPGQIVARVGKTGRSTGPHLHLQVLRNGKDINPAEVFKF